MLTPGGEWSTGEPPSVHRTITTRPASAGLDSSQKRARPSEHSSLSDTLARATSDAASGDAQCP